MKTKTRSSKLLLPLLAGLALASTTANAAPPPTAFTYQGSLMDNGSPANGPTAMDFTLWDAPVGGNQVGPLERLTVNVTDGLFTESLDFGAAAFSTNQALWLQIEVSGVTLGRQPLSAVPTALNTRGLLIDGSNNVSFGGSLLLPDVATIGGRQQSGIQFVNPSLTIQAPGAVECNEAGTLGGELILRSGNAQTAGTSTFDGESWGNDVRIVAGDNVWCGAGSTTKFNGNILFEAGDASTNGGVQPERMRIVGDNGRVGIGTDSPDGMLTVDSGLTGPALVLRRGPGARAAMLMESELGSYSQHRDTSNGFAWDIYANKNDYAIVRSGIAGAFSISAATGNVYIGNGAATSYKLDVQGDVRCFNLVQTSSREFKDEIAPLTGALASIMNLQGVTYTWNDSAPEQIRGGHDIGFIADEMNAVLPDIVAKDENGKPIGIDYGKITPVAVEAIKELKAENDALKARLDRLESVMLQRAERD